MVKVIIHHGGRISFDHGTYVGGEVFEAGRFDPDYLSVTHLWKFVKEDLKYHEAVDLWCKFDGEPVERGIRRLESDRDVLDIIQRIEKYGEDSLRIFVDHKTSVADVYDVNEKLLDQWPHGVFQDSVEEEVVFGARHDGDQGYDPEELDDEELDAARVDRELSDFEESDEEDVDLFGDTPCVDAEADPSATSNDQEKARGKRPIVDEEDVGTNQEPTNGHAEARKASMDWFGCGSTCGVDVEDPVASESEASKSISEHDDSDSDGPRRRKCRDFHEDELKGRVHLERGMRFRDFGIFKVALKLFGVQRHFDFKYIKNDKLRATAVCKRACGWKIHASFMYRKDAVQIKHFQPRHQCGAHHKNTKLNYKFTAAHYLWIVRDDPNIPATALANHIRRDFHVCVSKNHVYRAKKLALEMIYRKHADQYNYVYDYCEALIQSNPGTCVKVHRDGPRFQRIYVRLDACKRGFLDGCRPVIVLDCCHLKGPFGGQLLCAVGKDANDDMYPLAYAVCEVERRSSWTWFIQTLIEDIGEERAWTWMSDRQKGLRESLEGLVPNEEQRHCVRHLHANVKSQGFRGKPVKDALWRAARSCTEVIFKQNMENLKEVSAGAYDYLSKVDPKGWSKHAFRTTTKCDILLSNIAETFNSWIKEARDKPLLTMLDVIRRMLMNRFKQKRLGISKASWEICPRIKKKTGKKQEHVCAAIFPEKLLPEDFVDDCYRKAAYEASYSHVIYAMPGANLWPQSASGPLQPPVWRAMQGRPKKARVRAEDEPHHEYHVTRRGLPVRCGKCLVEGHNAQSCNKPENPNRRIYPKKPSKEKEQPENGDGQPGTSTEATGQKTRKRKKVATQNVTQDVPEPSQPQPQPVQSLSQPVQSVSKGKKSNPRKKEKGQSQPIPLRRSPRKKAGVYIQDLTCNK